MGTNCGPVLANLYLFSYEYIFMSRIIERYGDNYARKFHLTFRLNDDVLAIDNTSFQKHAAIKAEDPSEIGIYPGSLELNVTNESEKTVCFLGMKIIDSKDATPVFDVFDKRDEFPFPVIRYPHMDSLIPKSMPYGVFTGQLCRYYRICTRWKSFINRAVTLAITLRNQGSQIRRLIKTFDLFLNRKQRFRWKKVSPSSLSSSFKSGFSRATRKRIREKS